MISVIGDIKNIWVWFYVGTGDSEFIEVSLVFKFKLSYIFYSKLVRIDRKRTIHNKFDVI